MASFKVSFHLVSPSSIIYFFFYFRYLNMTISADSGIRKQDGARAFAAVARNNIGYEIAFDFLVTNIKEISE